MIEPEGRVLQARAIGCYSNCEKQSLLFMQAKNACAREKKAIEKERKKFTRGRGE